jgi:MFS family permease
VAHRVVLRESIVALQHRNFRLIWLGLLLSFIGSFMQNAAILWHVSLLVAPENKGLALGLVGLVRVLPIVIFSLVSGVVADAFDRRRLMLATNIAAAAVAIALAALTLRGLTVVWPLYALAAVGAAVSAFDLPARQALVPTLVPREHLPNAIALSSIMLQLASVIGPSVGGLLIAAEGVASAYIVNAISFGFVILALMMMREPEGTAAAEPRSANKRDDISLTAAREGLRFVFQSPLIRSTMILDFLVTFFASATALLPIYAQDILKVGPQGYGWLFAAPSAGALLTSAAMVPLTERIDRRGKVLIWAVVGHGIATVAFGFSTGFWLAFIALALTGATDTVSMVIRNIVRQLETPDRLRGRMTGINMVFFIGGPQLGELEAGLVAHWFNAPFSVVSGGIGCLLATAWITSITPALRRYRREQAPAATATTA